MVRLVMRFAHITLSRGMARLAARAFRSDTVPVAYRELAKDGYVFVAQDIRGRFQSGGTFVTSRAQNDPRNAPGTNESTDAWDTIDWLVKHVPHNNGRVGVIGTSCSGWLAGLAAVGAHHRAHGPLCL